MTSKISEAYSPIPQRRRSNGQLKAEFGEKRTVFPFKILKVNLVIETKEYAYIANTPLMMEVLTSDDLLILNYVLICSCFCKTEINFDITFHEKLPIKF